MASVLGKFTTRRVIYIIFWILWWIPFSFFTQLHNLRHIPHRKHAVIIANHESYLDPLLIIYALSIHRYIRFVAKSSFQKVHYVQKEEQYHHKTIFQKILGNTLTTLSVFFVHYTGSIIIKPGTSTVRRAIRALSYGHFVGLFPAGTRRKRLKDGTATVRKGFVVIARQAKVPILPVAIYKKGLFWHVRILPPIPPERLDDDTFGTTDAQRACAIMQRLNNTLPAHHHVTYVPKNS